MSFTKKHFHSGNGMQTCIWGPPMWFTLHTISFNYPVKPTEADKDNYTEFLMSLKNVLACVYCRQNFLKNLKSAKFSRKCMASRDTFSRFIYNLHNHINKMLNKKIKITYNEVRVRYEHFRARCSDKKIETNLKKEKGCVNALHGTKSKCVIQIVPKNSRRPGFKMDAKCKKI